MGAAGRTGTVQWDAPDDPHPARDAQRNALRCAVAGDRAGWLALWSPEGEIRDPVGPSPFDPRGDGLRGPEQIARFWDEAIAPVNRFDVVVRRSYASGDSSAQEATFTTTFGDGTVASIDLITVYRVDEEGRILAMHAYWEADRVRLH